MSKNERVLHLDIEPTKPKSRKIAHSVGDLSLNNSKVALERSHSAPSSAPSEAVKPAKPAKPAKPVIPVAKKSAEGTRRKNNGIPQFSFGFSKAKSNQTSPIEPEEPAHFSKK